MQLLCILGQKQENIFADMCSDVSFVICIERQSSLNGCLLKTFIETTESFCVLKCYTLADCRAATFSSNGSCKIHRAPNSGEICNVVSDLASNYHKMKDGIKVIFIWVKYPYIKLMNVFTTYWYNTNLFFLVLHTTHNLIIKKRSNIETQILVRYDR